jgi:hypothetical protein
MTADTKPTLDERVARLEQLAARLIDLAAEHPLGRVILRRLGIE